LILFVINETRAAKPLAPLSILRVRGLAGANVVLAMASAGILAMFFFLALYLQDTLGYSPLKAGLSLLPITAGFIAGAGITTQLLGRIGTKPGMIVGPIIVAAGLLVLSGIPADGTYLGDVLPGIMISAVGAGIAFVSLITGANNGVGAHDSGLAAGLINTSQQIGGALGFAILSAVATAHTKTLLGAGHVDRAHALTGGFQQAFTIGAIFLLGAAALAAFTPRVLPAGETPAGLADRGEPCPATA
jgi:predicted MFS family arabinose efflux permease